MSYSFFWGSKGLGYYVCCFESSSFKISGIAISFFLKKLFCLVLNKYPFPPARRQFPLPIPLNFAKPAINTFLIIKFLLSKPYKKKQFPFHPFSLPKDDVICPLVINNQDEMDYPKIEKPAYHLPVNRPSPWSFLK